MCVYVCVCVYEFLCVFLGTQHKANLYSIRASATNTGLRRDVAWNATNGYKGGSNPMRVGKKSRRDQGPVNQPAPQQ